MLVVTVPADTPVHLPDDRSFLLGQKCIFLRDRSLPWKLVKSREKKLIFLDLLVSEVNAQSRGRMKVWARKTLPAEKCVSMLEPSP